MACEKENIDIISEVDAELSAEEQQRAEQLFAKAIGQLLTQKPDEAVREWSTGSERDIAAQQELATHAGFPPIDAVKFSADCIHQHLERHQQQHEQG